MGVTTTNYTGRSVDVALFGVSQGGAVDMGLRPTALAVAGKLKASQNYIRALLSTAEERKEDPEFGSSMVGDFRSSNISFPVQIEQAFAIANLSVLKWMKDRYTSSVPADERVDSTKLTNYSIEPGGKISLNIQLTTSAGESVAFCLPVVWSRT